LTLYSEPATVEYRLDELEEDIGAVENLIEEIGKFFSIKKLSKWKAKKAA